MTWTALSAGSRLDFVQEIKEKSDLDLSVCYQCGKCTAGCPVAYAMDFPPNQIMRAVQLGMRDAALTSRSIWLCVACETCSTRCPQEVDPAGVMDVLRHIAYAEGAKSPEVEVPLFHRIFLGTVKQFGRVFELGMIGLYNVFSGHFLKDMALAPKMFIKGKMNVLPPREQNIQGVKAMFAMAKELEAEKK